MEFEKITEEPNEKDANAKGVVTVERDTKNGLEQCINAIMAWFLNQK